MQATLTRLQSIIDYFTTWQPLELIGLVGAFLLFWLTMSCLSNWRRVRETQARSLILEQLVQKQFSAQELEQLIRTVDRQAGPETPTQAISTIGAKLVELEVTGEHIEELMGLIRESNQELQLAISSALSELEYGVDERQILGLVRGLCKPASTVKQSSTKTNPDELVLHSTSL